LYPLSTLRADITDDYARLASGWGVNLYRWDSDPLGVNEGVLAVSVRRALKKYFL